MFGKAIQSFDLNKTVGDLISVRKENYILGYSKENIEVLPINGSNRKSSHNDKKMRSQMDVDVNGVAAFIINVQ